MIKKIRTNKGRYGQTASELAIFGALLVFILGIVIKYAINFNFQQQSSMEAFRKAHQLAAERDAASQVLIIDDKDLPDVSNPLAIPASTPFSGAAGVMASQHLIGTRSYGNADLIPILDMFINGKRYQFTTAAFRQPLFPAPNLYANYPSLQAGYVHRKIIETDPKFNDPSAYFEPGLPANASWKWLPERAHVFSFGAIVLGADEYFFKGEGESADVDGDGKEESVFGVEQGDCTQYATEQECRSWCNWLGGGLTYAQNQAVFDCCKTHATCNSGASPFCKDKCTGLSCFLFMSRSTCEMDCLGAPDCFGCAVQSCVDNCRSTCKHRIVSFFKVVDYQEGDLDLTIDSKDIRQGKTTQGLMVSGTTSSNVEPGSFHQRQEDASKIINTTVLKRKDKIERLIQLNCHTPSVIVFGRPLSPDDCWPPNSHNLCCGSQRVIDQAKEYFEKDGDFIDPETGVLHVFSTKTGQKTKIWTTPK